VTGDSLGQVASQTLPNLAVAEQASSLPVLRPLLALDKAEIIDEARELGTLEVSNLPDEDCCQLFASKLAETRADARQLKRLEQLVDAGELIERLVAEARAVRPGDQGDARARNGRHTALPAGV
jgi:tRNA uracil 4-sulfurtransferase